MRSRNSLDGWRLMKSSRLGPSRMIAQGRLTTLEDIRSARKERDSWESMCW
jgi:hypothetical protein